MLNNLERCDFIMKFRYYVKNNNNVIYKLTDFYTLKFSQGEYRIMADYEEKLHNRMALFKEKTKNKMTLVHTFVTTFGVANGKHSSLVHSEVTLDGLFIA